MSGTLSYRYDWILYIYLTIWSALFLNNIFRKLLSDSILIVISEERFFIFFPTFAIIKAFQLLFLVRKMALNTTELLNSYYVQYTVLGLVNNSETKNIPIQFSFFNSLFDTHSDSHLIRRRSSSSDMSLLDFSSTPFFSLRLFRNSSFLSTHFDSSA